MTLASTSRQSYSRVYACEILLHMHYCFIVHITHEVWHHLNSIHVCTLAVRLPYTRFFFTRMLKGFYVVSTLTFYIPSRNSQLFL